MQWENVPEKIEDWFGFVYRITCLTNNKKYIGKKQFWSNQKRPPLKGKKRGRRVIKESDWKEYYGSSNDLKADLQKYGKENFKREILELTTCKWENAYLELMWQLKENALLREEYYNGILNIRLNSPPKDLVEKYKNIKTDSEKEYDEYKKCKDDIIYFAEKYIKISDLEKGQNSKLNLYEKQKEILKLWESNKKHVTLSARQSGISLLQNIFVLHNCIFNRSKTAVIMTNKEHQCHHIINEILKMIYTMKLSLKPDFSVSNNIISFYNESKITVVPYGVDYIRGRGCGIIILDNPDYCDESVLEELSACLVPVVNSSKNNKLIISGTANSYDSFMMKKYKSGEYTTNKIIWSDIPNRDNKWKTMIQNSLGEKHQEIWEKEFECFHI